MDGSDDYESRPVTAGDIFAPLRSRAHADATATSYVAVLDAVQATIATTLHLSRDADTPPGSHVADTAPLTAYFAAFMSALERSGASHAQQVLYLLSLVLPHISASVLRSKASAVTALLSTLASSPGVVKDASTLRPALSCLATTLSALDVKDDTWSRPEVSRALAAMLSFTTEARPKIRHAAQAGVVALLSAHHKLKERAAGAACALYLTAFLRGSSGREVHRLLQAVPFLRSVLPLMAEKDVIPLAEEVLRLPMLGNARLTVSAYAVMASLLESPLSRLTITFVSRVVQVMASASPSADDHAAAGEYAFAVAAAVTRLASMERLTRGMPVGVDMHALQRSVGSAARAGGEGPVIASVAAALPIAIDALLPLLEAERPAVHHAVSNAVALCLAASVDGPLIAQAHAHMLAGGPRTGPAAPSLLRILVALEALLQFKYQASWSVSLPVLALAYALMGGHASPLMNGVTLALVTVRDAIVAACDARDVADVDAAEDAYEADARIRKQKRHAARKRARRGGDSDSGSSGSDDEEDADDDRTEAASTAARTYRVVMSVLAAAVRAMGAVAFVQLVPFLAPPETSPAAPVREDRAWLLNLLRSNAQYAACDLTFFTGVIIPAIRTYETLASAAQGASLPRNARAHRARMIQLWGLLPSLMVAPPDFATAFNAPLGKFLTQSLSDARYPELVPIICRALETVIVTARAAAGLPALSHADVDADDASDDEGARSQRGGGNAALTVFARARARGTGRDAENDDDDEHGEAGDNDDEDDGHGTQGGAAGGRDDTDGATTVFGAGGVSVFAGADSADARHPLLVQAMRMRHGAPEWSREAASAALEVLRTFARNYLPVLFNVYEMLLLGLTAPPAPPSVSAAPATGAPSSSSQERARKVLDAIGAYLSCAPPDLITAITERLLALLASAQAALESADAAMASLRNTSKATPAAVPSAALEEGKRGANAAAARVVSLLSLSNLLCGFLPAMSSGADAADTHPVLRLYATIQPAIKQDVHTNVQKRAYAVLARLLWRHPAYIANSDTRRTDMVSNLTQSLLSVSPAARRWRLRCLKYVVAALDIHTRSHTDLLPVLVGEVMLCTKDSNAKVRTAAFQLLMAMAVRMSEGGDGDAMHMDDDAAAPAVSLAEYFRMIVAGYAAVTPHMRSAAVRSMSRLLYEYSDRPVVHAMLPELLETTLLLLREKSREVVASVVGFVKVVASCMPPEELLPHVAGIVTALMTWAKETKNQIRAKIRGVLERMVRKVGYDPVAASMPASDSALLAHMRKMSHRRERRRSSAATAVTGEAMDVDGDSKSGVSRARTAFEAMAGITDGIGEGGDDDSEELGAGARSAVTAASIAKSWRVVGSVMGTSSAAGTSSVAGGARASARGSHMTAVAAAARSVFAPVAAAPLPPVGAVLDGGIVSKRSNKSVVSQRSRRTEHSSSGRLHDEAVQRYQEGGMLQVDDDAPLDLMDSNTMRRVVGVDARSLARTQAARRAAAAADAGVGGFKVNPEGKLIITEDESDDDTRRRKGRAAVAAPADDDMDEEEAANAALKEDDDADLRAHKAKMRGVSRVRTRPAADTGGDEDKAIADGGDHDRSRAASRASNRRGRSDAPAAPHEQGWGMRKKKTGSTGGDGRAGKFSGAQYRASKGGDVLRKDASFEPFAYVPLDPKSMSGGGRARSVSRFDSVVASTSKSGRMARKRGDGTTAAAGAKRRRE